MRAPLGCGLGERCRPFSISTYLSSVPGFPLLHSSAEVNLEKLACGSPLPAIIGLSVMKNELAANRWSL